MAVGVLLDNSGRSCAAVVQPGWNPGAHLRSVGPHSRDRTRHEKLREDQVAIGATLYIVRFEIAIKDDVARLDGHDLIGARVAGATPTEEEHEMSAALVVVHGAFSTGWINNHFAADGPRPEHLRRDDIDALASIVLRLQQRLVLPIHDTKRWWIGNNAGIESFHIGDRGEQQGGTVIA